MGALGKFLGEPKKIEIGGNEFEIHPLKVKDLKKFNKVNPSQEEQEKMAKDIIKLSVPGTTDEEVDNLPMEVFVKITEEINKLNGFTNESIEKLKQTNVRK